MPPDRLLLALSVRAPVPDLMREAPVAFSEVAHVTLPEAISTL